MRIQTIFSLLFVVILGCQQEPTTLRGQAEQAQEELAAARDEAAEMIANSEEDAVNEVADAREDAKESIQQSKRKATGIVADAKADLDRKLDRLQEAGIPHETTPTSDAAPAESFLPK